MNVKIVFPLIDTVLVQVKSRFEFFRDGYVTYEFLKSKLIIKA